MCVFTRNMPRFRSQMNPNPGTCNARLRRKFHILRYRRTSISSRVLDGFQNSYNCCCYKWVESMWKWRPAGELFFFFPLPLLSTCLTMWKRHVCTVHTHRHRRPVLLDFGATSLSLAGCSKGLCLISVCGRALQVVYPDSEVVTETLVWCFAVLLIHSLTSSKGFQITAGAALPRRNS